MPQKKPDQLPTQSLVLSPQSSPLSFTIETFDDPETGKPTQYGRFSRHWQDEEALDVLIDKLGAGQLTLLYPDALSLFDQLAADVFVQQTGSQRLVRNALFQGARLKVFQVSAGNADVQALVFLESGNRCRAV